MADESDWSGYTLRPRGLHGATPNDRVKVLQWDWKAQPDLEEIAVWVRELSGGTCDLREVPATGGDMYAVAIANHALTGEQAQAAFETADRESNR